MRPSPRVYAVVKVLLLKAAAIAKLRVSHIIRYYIYYVVFSFVERHEWHSCLGSKDWLSYPTVWIESSYYDKYYHKYGRNEKPFLRGWLIVSFTKLFYLVVLVFTVPVVQPLNKSELKMETDWWWLVDPSVVGTKNKKNNFLHPIRYLISRKDGASCFQELQYVPHIRQRIRRTTSSPVII